MVILSATNPTAEDLSKASVLGRCIAKFDSLDQAVEQIKSNFGTIDFIVEVSSVDEAVSVFNVGAWKVLVDSSLLSELVEAGIDTWRIVVRGDTNGECAGVLLDDTCTSISEIASKSAKSLDPNGSGCKVVYEVSKDGSHAQGAIAVVPASAVTRALPESSEGKLSLANLIIKDLKTDRQDGLYTTLVVDEYDQAYGLVYSSKESIAHAVATGTGVYQSRSRGEVWFKGKTSGCVQALKRIEVDCDADCLKFVVDQAGSGFCHNGSATCFGILNGLTGLEKTLLSRKASAPAGSYTNRLFNDPALLVAKIKEEADELCEANTKDEIAWEAADLFYFALTKLVATGVSLKDVERNLDMKARKVSRRKGDAKEKYLEKKEEKKEETAKPVSANATSDGMIKMNFIEMSDKQAVTNALTRPAQKSSDIMNLVKPIIDNVKQNGDKALIELTAKFDKVQLDSPVLEAPFPAELMQVSDEIRQAIDLSIENIEKFHKAQTTNTTLRVETQPGVICSRFARGIEKVGLYIPGGTAVLPSTAMMLGVPANVAGCKEIVFASPPGRDGKLTPEVVYVAHKVGASKIVLAGGAQAVAALAYGTESVPKVNKIMGPGNQFVTAAKMFVSNDASALVAIDMPAGPSEVLVVADSSANPEFVASDLLSQAEHGVDSQVILIAVGLSDKEQAAMDEALHRQALALPRVDIVRGSIAHSTTIAVSTMEEAMKLSNEYAPEHLILQVKDASSYVKDVQNAGSVFVGAWSPESCGDYSSGTNHTLPTYGYAKMYSGVNTATFQKHITSQELTEEGIEKIGDAVMALAHVEGLDAHRNAVKVRVDDIRSRK